MSLNEIMQQITTIIASNAFPIVMCVILLKINEQLRQEMLKMSEDHKAESDRLADVIQENTVALVELKEKLS